MVHFIPLARTAEIFSTLYGLAPSDGTISLNLNVAAERLNGFEAQVKVALLAEPVLYADETSSKVDGKLQWLHIVTCASYTLYGHHRGCGYDALVAMGVLPDYRSTLMHDACVFQLRTVFLLLKAALSLTSEPDPAYEGMAEHLQGAVDIGKMQVRPRMVKAGHHCEGGRSDAC
ncbi:transposase [Deinococcus radiomollis]|uniref:IS66 family transposase n=1 Tax=Deinococcus radiomollis TaxID=468916 RepID=UPI00389210FE